MIDSHDAHSEEFTILLTQCERQLFAYILAMVWSAQDAEDLYQQTAMLLWKKFEEYERGTNFRSWAFSFARHVVLNFQRSQQRRKTFLTAELASTLADRQATKPDDKLNSFADALGDCMGLLSDPDRRLIHLCYGDELTIKQIAENLGRPAQSTYNSLCRIRRRLFDCVKRAVSRDCDA